LGNEPFLDFAPTSEKKTACTLFLGWRLKYNNRAAGLAPSAPLPDYGRPETNRSES
jgi:hypothetical protein